MESTMVVSSNLKNKKLQGLTGSSQQKCIITPAKIEPRVTILSSSLNVNATILSNNSYNTANTESSSESNLCYQPVAVENITISDVSSISTALTTESTTHNYSFTDLISALGNLMTINNTIVYASAEQEQQILELSSAIVAQLAEISSEMTDLIQSKVDDLNAQLKSAHKHKNWLGIFTSAVQVFIGAALIATGNPAGTIILGNGFLQLSGYLTEFIDPEYANNHNWDDRLAEQGLGGIFSQITHNEDVGTYVNLAIMALAVVVGGAMAISSIGTVSASFVAGESIELLSMDTAKFVASIIGNLGNAANAGATFAGLIKSNIEANSDDASVHGGSSALSMGLFSYVLYEVGKHNNWQEELENKDGSLWGSIAWDACLLSVSLASMGVFGKLSSLTPSEPIIEFNVDFNEENTEQGNISSLNKPKDVRLKIQEMQKDMQEFMKASQTYSSTNTAISSIINGYTGIITAETGKKTADISLINNYMTTAQNLVQQILSNVQNQSSNQTSTTSQLMSNITNTISNSITNLSQQIQKASSALA